MKDFTSINENELDGALNALFLETYSQKTDEGMARFFMEQEYAVVIDLKKEAELLARLNGKQGGGKNIILMILALLFIIASSLFFFNGNKGEKKIVSTPQHVSGTSSGSGSRGKQTTSSPLIVNSGENKEGRTPANTPPSLASGNQTVPVIDSATQPQTYIPEVKNETPDEKMLPYFNKEGLAYFAKVKERMMQKLVKIDDLLYAKTEPGATMYKSREVLISPFVMSNFPVTNLQYKVFLADLAMNGRVDDLKKCLPKEELWKDYSCYTLAKNYFEDEAYNDFPVVNVQKEACMIFCEWLEEETNKKLESAPQPSKLKASVKKKQVMVRLPYDYEWIYSADAAYTLIPNCGGYNTIYDASEGLVDKDFYKRTSQVNKRDLRKETRMDQLSDVNRFGMTETEMISIFKEAIRYKEDNSKSTADPSDPASYPNNIEACCLAGHVCELIKDKDGGMVVRGCCWKNKEEYLKMLDAYKKNGASPFVGFRVMILNAERGSDKNPFW